MIVVVFVCTPQLNKGIPIITQITNKLKTGTDNSCTLSNRAASYCP